jgi:hypothetical protein
MLSERRLAVGVPRQVRPTGITGDLSEDACGTELDGIRSNGPRYDVRGPMCGVTMDRRERTVLRSQIFTVTLSDLCCWGNRIDVNNTPVTDASLIYLKGSTHLERLALSGNSRDAGLDAISGLNRVRLLHAGGTLITDAGVLSVAGMANLENLALLGTKITAAGLESLVGLKKLRMLDLTGNAVSTADVASLHETLPECEITLGSGGGTTRFPGSSPSE